MAFQANLAAEVRNRAEIAIMAVGLIWQAAIANRVVEEGKADLVAVARALLNDPNWTLHAAAELGADQNFSLCKPALGWWLDKRQRALRKLGLLD